MHANVYLEDSEGQITVRVGNAMFGNNEHVHVSVTVWDKPHPDNTLGLNINLDQLIDMLEKDDFKNYMEKLCIEKHKISLPNYQVASNMVKQCLKALMGGRFIPNHEIQEVNNGN